MNNLMMAARTFLTEGTRQGEQPKSVDLAQGLDEVGINSGGYVVPMLTTGGLEGYTLKAVNPGGDIAGQGRE